jgi:hypothetical protein
MPFMASVNRLSLYVGIPILIIIYVAYVISTYVFYDDQGRNQAIHKHYKNIASSKTIDALILGGSNAVFSLSAEILSEQLPYNFYNAALVNEGFGTSNYYSFVDALITEQKASEIKLVIFSSIDLVRSRQEIEKRDSRNRNSDLAGKPSYPSILPERTFARFLLDRLTKGNSSKDNSYGEISSKGEFLFDEFKCKFNPSKQKPFELPDISTTLALVKERMLFMKKKFPQAKYLIVFPSEYDDHTSKRNQYLSQIGSELERLKIDYIAQGAISDSALICDAKHHANEKGRIVRTKDLIEQFEVMELK